MQLSLFLESLRGVEVTARSSGHKTGLFEVPPLSTPINYWQPPTQDSSTNEMTDILKEKKRVNVQIDKIWKLGEYPFIHSFVGKVEWPRERTGGPFELSIY